MANDPHRFEGHSNSGDLTEAIDDAIQQGKLTLRTDTLEWRLLEVGGVYGGFIDARDMKVVISGRSPKSHTELRSTPAERPE